MSMKSKLLTYAQAHRLFDYDPETGILRWRESRGPVTAGRECGCMAADGYRCVRVDRRSYFAHRIVWLLMTGEWPKQHIDHRNGNPGDNRWKNLREATNSENMQNVGGLIKSNKSGFRGVFWHRQSSKWRAQIRVSGECKHLGLYDTKEEAAAAYAKAQKQLHPFRRVQEVECD